ncbi:MAG: histidine kinase [Bacteroidales bacterium]|nr:histidine kinase [Bacteroidales bacterium]
MKTHKIITKILNSKLSEVVLWILAFSMPLLFFLFESDNAKVGHDIDFLIYLWSLLIVFILNYRVFVTRNLIGKKKNILKYILNNVLLISILLGIMIFSEKHIKHARRDVPPTVYIEELYCPLPGGPEKYSLTEPFDILKPLLPPPSPHHHKRPFINKMFILSKVLPLILMVGMALGTKTITVARSRGKKIDKLQHNYDEAELKNLRKQFSPHFIFNTLNNIYALVDISPQKAQTAIMQLSGIMRDVMFKYQTIKFVPLQNSIKLIEDYISLMSLRVPEDLDLQVSLPKKFDTIYVAPLIFVVLVENAFKHGISPSKRSFIYIKIEIDDNNVTCLVENSYYRRNDVAQNTTGVGIDNLRKSLDIVYNGEYSFELKHDEEKYLAKLVVPIKREESEIC